MSYRAELEHAIIAWNRNPIEDEWSFQTFRDEVIGIMSSEEAYSHIDGTIEVLMTQTDESTAIEILESILALARKSNTTEVPAKLNSCRRELKEQFAGYGDYANGKYNELLVFYRLS